MLIPQLGAGWQDGREQAQTGRGPRQTPLSGLGRKTGGVFMTPTATMWKGGLSPACAQSVWEAVAVAGPLSRRTEQKPGVARVLLVDSVPKGRLSCVSWPRR